MTSKQNYLLKFVLSLILLSLFIPIASFASSPLPVKQAFMFTASVNQKKEIVLQWKMPPGYYLYRDRMQISSIPWAVLSVHYPQGTIKYSNHNRIEVYFDHLTIAVLINSLTQYLEVKYQGCSDQGFCYPPQEERLNISELLSSSNSVNQSVSQQRTLLNLLTDQNGIQTLLSTERDGWVLLLFLGLGLLLAFTPCVLPMIPILTSIIVGQKKRNTYKAFLLSSCYVMGSAITYAFAGLLAASMGSSLQVWLQQPVIIITVSLLFVLLACSLFGFYHIQLPNRWHNKLIHLSNKQKSGNYIGVFLMGVISTLIVSPCVTAPLVGILLYISQTGEILFGASALFVLGIGMGIPLLMIGVSAGKFLPKSGPWMDLIKKSFGIMMLAMAIWLVSRVVSITMTQILWQLLVILTISGFLFYLPFLKKRRLHISVSLLTIIAGFILIFGLGVSNPLLRWMNLHNKPQSFKVVNNVKDFTRQLAKAKSERKPIMLDFYADWCDACITMDEKVFNEPTVKNILANYILLRADLSINSSADEAMLKYFGVIAPPTVLFFDANGKELNNLRIVGEVDAKEFLTRIGKQ